MATLHYLLDITLHSYRTADRLNGRTNKNMKYDIGASLRRTLTAYKLFFLSVCMYWCVCIRQACTPTLYTNVTTTTNDFDVLHKPFVDGFGCISFSNSSTIPSPNGDEISPGGTSARVPDVETTSFRMCGRRKRDFMCVCACVHAIVRHRT